jgi:hypothetical protein
MRTTITTAKAITRNRLPSLRNIGYENYESEMKSYRKLLETVNIKLSLMKTECLISYFT